MHSTDDGTSGSDVREAIVDAVAAQVKKLETLLANARLMLTHARAGRSVEAQEHARAMKLALDSASAMVPVAAEYQHVIRPPRYVTIRWDDLLPLMLRFSQQTFWRDVPIIDPYDQYRRCCGRDCWFTGNMDRLEDLTLYSLIGARDGVLMCGVCMANDATDAALRDKVLQIDVKEYGNTLQCLISQARHEQD